MEAKMDEIDCLIQAPRILDRKILNGFRIYETMETLNIPPVLGVRDLL